MIETECSLERELVTHVAGLFLSVPFFQSVLGKELVKVTLSFQDSFPATHHCECVCMCVCSDVDLVSVRWFFQALCQSYWKWYKSQTGKLQCRNQVILPCLIIYLPHDRPSVSLCQSRLWGLQSAGTPALWGIDFLSSCLLGFCALRSQVVWQGSQETKAS